MYAIHQQAAPPSGYSHVVSARLTPSCLQSTSTSKSRIVRNLVTANGNHIQLFEVVETLGNDVYARVTQANGVNGVDTDEKGKKLGRLSPEQPDQTPARARLDFVREHTVHGIVTGLQRIQTIDTARDGLDRLLISFKDAKMSLMEWSPDLYDLVPLSLHTFEKLPHIMQGDLTGYRSILRTDPHSRCSAMLLPHNSLAITPFFQDQIELEGAENANIASLPYAASFTIELEEINPQLRNIIDFVFLAGFNEPTIAILSQPTLTWTGRLENAKDTVQLFLLTLDVTSTPPASTIISTTASLPFDSLYLTACPKDLGGVMITTANALMHVDQAGKKTGVSLNGWANMVTDLSKADAGYSSPMELEDSRVLFVTAELCLLFLKSGLITAVKVQRNGRSISNLSVLPDSFDSIAAPCAIELIRSHLTPKAPDGVTQACYAFVASLVGNSELIRVDFRTEAIDETEAAAVEAESQAIASGKAEDDMDEDDIDIYGSADAKAAVLTAEAAQRKAANTRLKLRTESCMSLGGYGAIRSAVIGTIAQDAPPELVACTGDGYTGGLTIIHRSLLPSKRQRMNLDHSTESLWTVELHVDGAANGHTDEHKFASRKNYLFTSQDRETQIYDISSDIGEPEHIKTYGKTTLAVAAIRDGRDIAYLIRDKLIVLNGDLKERQGIKLPDDSVALSASFSGPYILVTRDEAPPLLYKDNIRSGKLEQQELPSHITEKSVSTLFADPAGCFPRRKRKSRRTAQVSISQIPPIDGVDMMNSNDDDIYGESSANVPQSARSEQVPTDERTPDDEADMNPDDEVWLCSSSSEGHFTITGLSSGELLFSAYDFFTFPSIIEDSRSQYAMEDMPEDSVLEHLVLSYVGTQRSRLFLTLLMEDGTLVTYEAVSDYGFVASRPESEHTLGLRFVKAGYRSLPAAQRAKPTSSSGTTPPSRRLIPFEGYGDHSGLLITGDAPLWLLAEDHAASRFFDCPMRPLHGFAISTTGQGIFSLDEETVIGELTPETDISRPLPFTKVVENRLYMDIAFDQPSQSYIAVASYAAPFEIYDEQGDPVNKLHGDGLLEPTATRSTLELIVPGTWETIDGYEFRQYETATSIKSVSLETRSTVSGYKDFIAVGTIITRGEDLTSRGAVYVFEVTKGEPARDESHPRRQLRLLCQEDLKSAVSCVSALNGYLLHSVGLKIYIKAFEQDEKLISLGFLDVNLQTTCMRSMKNLLLLGDALNGLNFIAFQEDPYKFISLGREVGGTPVVTADFLVLDNRSMFITTDMHGVIRLFEYDPMRAETNGGQRLLPRVEFRTSTEAAFSVPFARSVTGDAKQNGILYLNMDGSLSTIVPVRDAVYRRLQLLERQLVRHTPHFAGLNPRAFRTVRNDREPRPLTKGLLDGELLSSYTLLSSAKQQQLADPLGSDRDTINYNLKSLKAPW